MFDHMFNIILKVFPSLYSITQIALYVYSVDDSDIFELWNIR